MYPNLPVVATWFILSISIITNQHKKKCSWLQNAVLILPKSWWIVSNFTKERKKEECPQSKRLVISLKFLSSQNVELPSPNQTEMTTSKSDERGTTQSTRFLLAGFPSEPLFYCRFFIYCHENDTCHQKLQYRQHLTHYQGGEKGRVWGGFSPLNQKKCVLEKGKQIQENLC